MELSAPVDTISGPRGSRALGGLLISIKASTIEPLIAALPADLQSQIRGQITFDQVIAVQVAPAVVSAGAAKSIPFEPPVVMPPAAPTVDNGDTSSAGEPLTPIGETDTTKSPIDTGVGSAPIVGGTTIALQPVKSDFDGVPVWLTILLVLIAVVASRPLTMLADRIFAARGAAGCPNERD
jgi:hypothetical protein